MKIEIKERSKGDGSMSFDLVIDGKIVKKDTGLSNATDFLLSNYGNMYNKSCRKKND